MADLNPEAAGRLFGQVIAVAVLGLLFLLPVKQMFQARSSSGRLAYLSLALGMAFVLTLVAHMLFGEWIQPGATVLLGGVSILMGLGGLAAGLAALLQRQRDHGAGLGIPILGMVLSLAHAFIGFGMIALGTNISLPDPSDTSRSWVYTSPDHGFGLRLPSDHWSESKMPDGKVVFLHGMLRMQAIVLHVEQDVSEERFRTVVSQTRKIFGESATRRSGPPALEGNNAAGHPYLLMLGQERGGQGGDLFVGTSLTWHKEKRLLIQLLFEAQSQMLSQTFQKREQEAFEKSAEFIGQSVH